MAREIANPAQDGWRLGRAQRFLETLFCDFLQSTYCSHVSHRFFHNRYEVCGWRQPSRISQTGRGDDLADRPAGPAQSTVKGHQRTIQRLGQGHVPSVVAGQVAPQSPYTVGEWREWEQVQIEPKQIALCTVSLEPREFPDPFQPAQDVAYLRQGQFWTGQRALAHRRFRPHPFAPRVDQSGNQYGRIDDDRHVRSASRARKMLEGRTRVPAASLRSRTRCSQRSRDGRDAIRSNS